MASSGYPPGWEADYDGETERWFYTHKPTGVRQYHFPKPGDEIELAAAMARTKSSTGTNKALPSTPEPQATNIGAGQVQPSAPSTTSVATDQNTSPTLQRSLSERRPPSSSSTQPIPNLFKQSFQAASTQYIPPPPTSQPVLPPLDTQLQNTSRVPYQVPSSAHPLGVNTNTLSQGVNASPVQAMSAGPWSHSSSRGSISSAGRGSSFSSNDFQRIPDAYSSVGGPPPQGPPMVPGNNYMDQITNPPPPVQYSDADQILFARLGVLYLPDYDKENIKRHFINLVRKCPDVTLSQFMNHHIELPGVEPSDLGMPAENTMLSPEQPGKSFIGASTTNSPQAVPISEDMSLPIAFVAYSREPQPVQRTYTSPVAGPNPVPSTPSFGTPFDYQRHHHSMSNAPTNPTIVQTPLDTIQPPSARPRRPDSIGMHLYGHPLTAETDSNRPPGYVAEKPGLAVDIPVRPATTAPVQSFQSPGSRGTQRKPLSSQSPIVNRPNRSLSWQPRDHSDNPQLPSSLVSEESEPPTPRNTVQQESSVTPTSSIPTAVPPQQIREKNEVGQKEYDRLNAIIKEQNRQLALYQQNVQNPQDLQSNQNVATGHQIKQQGDVGENPHPTVPPSVTLAQSARSSIYTQSNYQNAQYAPSYPSVPVSPISRPESLVYPTHEKLPPLSLPQQAFNAAAGKQNGVGSVAETSSHTIDMPKGDSKDDDSRVWRDSQPGLTTMLEGTILGDGVMKDSGEANKDIAVNEPPKVKKEIGVAASTSRDGPESRGLKRTDSKRLSWSHDRKGSAEQQPSDQSSRQSVASNGSIPSAVSTNVPASSSRLSQELSDTPLVFQQDPVQASNPEPQQEIYPGHSVQTSAQPLIQPDTIQQPDSQYSNVPPSNDRSQPGHQRQRSQPRVDVPMQPPSDTAQGTSASQNQLQPVQSYQGQSNITQSAAYEMNLQTALEEQIQQHLEAVVSPPSAISPPDSRGRLHSDSVVSDMSTPWLAHTEYFDPVSVQHSQVITQKRLSKDLSTPSSAPEVVQPVQGHAKQPSIQRVATPEARQFYEEKQAFFPDHAPLKINAKRRSASIQSEVSSESKSISPPRQTEVPTRTSPPRELPVNDTPKSSNPSNSNRPSLFSMFSRPKDAEAAPNPNSTPEPKLDAPKPPTNVTTNQPVATASATAAPTSWQEKPQGPVPINQLYNSYNRPPTNATVNPPVTQAPATNVSAQWQGQTQGPVMNSQSGNAYNQPPTNANPSQPITQGPALNAPAPWQGQAQGPVISNPSNNTYSQPPINANTNQPIAHPLATNVPTTSWQEKPQDPITNNQSYPYTQYTQPPTFSYTKPDEKPAYNNNAETENLYDGGGYDDYDDFSDEEPAQIVPPRKPQMRRT